MIILVAYATVEGQTAKIAGRIAAQIEMHGHQVVLADLAQPGFALPGRIDGRFLPRRSISATTHRHSSSSSQSGNLRWWRSRSAGNGLAGDCRRRRRRARRGAGVLQETGQENRLERDHEYHAAGALKYLEYDFFKRWMLRRIARKEGGPVDTSKDYELTDWAALDRFVEILP